MNTQHAQARAQQRGIPPLVDELLERYGHEQHDGHGAVVLFLDKRSIRAMERDLGSGPSRGWPNGWTPTRGDLGFGADRSGMGPG
jgi:hypothetical protein